MVKHTFLVKNILCFVGDQQEELMCIIIISKLFNQIKMKF